jgi:2-polyprenyl-3-methyl-5-hydroxy-6-metoxy-1,4-benzoquinol methylase
MNTMPSCYDFTINPSSQMSSHAWLLRFVQGARSILEIGCSTGFFSQHLVAQGCRVVGVELNSAAAAQARSVCRRVIVGDIETPAVQAQVDEKFDAVVLGDVLEHLRAPGALLARIRESWLRPAGWVALSVPNSGHWIFRREVLRGHFPYRQYGLFDRSHIRFFTRASLHALVKDNGYTVERVALTVNQNCYDDMTFACLAPLYRRSGSRVCLIKVERWLAAALPSLFAYQFVLRIRPKT